MEIFLFPIAELSVDIHFCWQELSNKFCGYPLQKLVSQATKITYFATPHPFHYSLTFCSRPIEITSSTSGVVNNSRRLYEIAGIYSEKILYTKFCYLQSICQDNVRVHSTNVQVINDRIL